MCVVSGGDFKPLHGDAPAVPARQTFLPWRAWPASGGDGDLGHLAVGAHPRAWICWGVCSLPGTISRILTSETRNESQTEKQRLMIKEKQGLRAMKTTQSVSPEDGVGRRDAHGPCLTPFAASRFPAFFLPPSLQSPFPLLFV